MHDASEAYLSDLSRPVKHSPELTGYRVAEQKLEVIIAEVFGLEFPYPPEVKTADNRMLYTERRDVLIGHMEWTTDKQDVLGFEGNDRQPYDFRITPWEPKEAEKVYLERFHNLTDGKYNVS
jgi:5'-deoxynucleotidase YfbR-like HD superfamily hydrolase